MKDRYKPRGWFREPHRHALAAKGIKSKNYFSSKEPLVPGLFVRMFSLAASGDVQKAAKKGKNQQLFASKSKYQERGFEDRKAYLEDLAAQYGVDDYEVFALADALGPNEDFDGLVTSVDDISKGMYAKKYFVRNELKGNRESSNLHRAYAKGWTKDELRADADARQKFGISLAELQDEPARSGLPDSPSRAQERSFEQFDDFESEPITPIPAQDIPITEEPLIQEIPQDLQSFDEIPQEPVSNTVATPGIPERSSLGEQL